MDILKTINNNAIIIELFTAIAAVTIAVATLIMMHKHKKESEEIYLANLITDYASTAQILYKIDYGYLLPLKKSGYNPNFINIFSENTSRMPLIIAMNRYFIMFEILHKKATL